ncbi:MAG: efflux RND transporter periplasmic adaptor subunit [Anaerolineales bacterium]|nr:MAG: efflux RND transporter periplasmic adaptor subunit [Anaerolineales bacterium]
MKKNVQILISLFAALALFLAACGAEQTPAAPEFDAGAVAAVNDVIAEGRLVPVRGTSLSFLARGIVAEVLVQAGDTVSEGDVLMRLANAGAAEAQLLVAQNAYDALLRNESGDRARLWQAYMDAQVVRARAEEAWEDVDVDGIEDRIEDLEADVQDARDDLKDAQDEFDKYKDLDENNSRRQTAEDDLEDAQNELNSAIRALEEEVRRRDTVKAAYDGALAAEAEAKYQYEISLDGPNADQLALAKSNLDAAKDALANFVITAPFNGTIADVNVKVGDQVGPETRAVSLADFSAWIVETTDVTELEVVELRVGQSVTIVPDALPGVELSGVVTAISNAFIQQGGDILYTVRIRVDDADPRMKWGMTVETIFRTSE